MRYAVATIWVEECDPTQAPGLEFVEAGNEMAALEAVVAGWTFDDADEETWTVRPLYLDGTGPPAVWRGSTPLNFEPSVLATIAEIK